MVNISSRHSQFSLQIDILLLMGTDNKFIFIFLYLDWLFDLLMLDLFCLLFCGYLIVLIFFLRLTPFH